MKPSIRIFLAGALVLVIALGAWSAVFAEKGSPSASPVAGLSHLLAPLFQPSDKSSEVQTEVQTETETPPAVEDNPAQHEADATPEAIDAPEVGDDNHGLIEPGEHAGELSGTVTAIDSSTITVNGQVFQLATGAEGADKVQIGNTVKLELVTNADGTVSVREIKVGDVSGESVNDSSGGQQGGDTHSGSGGRDGGGSGGSGDGGDGGGSGG